VPRATRTERDEFILVLIGSLAGALFFAWAAVNTYLEASGDWNERILIESGRGAGASGTVTGFVYLYGLMTIGCLISLFFCIVALTSEFIRPRARRRDARSGRRRRR
jgi:hypothetical protein